MTAAAETGRAGERAAAEYLRRAGYEICALNWRQGRYELDIVARREEVLHFAFPAHCAQVAGRSPGQGREGEVQFDLAAAEAAPDGSVRVELIENALEYNW